MIPSNITWQAYDHVARPHSPDWYWAVSIIALAISTAAVLLHNTLFAILIIISTIALFLRTVQKPRLITYELTNRGIWFNKDFSPFATFEAFFVTEEEEPKLLLKAKGLTSPLSVISLEATNGEKVREYLQAYLRESELQEPLSKRIMEYLGF